MGEIVRLQKYIAMCGKASRRNAEKLITNGDVRVNGKVITELGTKVEIGADKVSVGGENIKVENKKYYILLNKPAGFVSTVHDQFDRPSVTDLLKKDINARVFPVGRLDYETEGALILTNDGDFANRVMHPKYNKSKTYIAVLSGGISISGINRLRRGIKIDDYKTQPAEIEILEPEGRKARVKITIHEGKNRQVRKMFEAVGSHVEYLQRIKIGRVELGNLKVGNWRHLTSHEVNSLKNM